MGSLGQAFGQGKPGYNAGTWDQFGLDDKMSKLENSISEIDIPDSLDSKTDKNLIDTIRKSIRQAQDDLTDIETSYDNNPEPDIMSNNQVDEARVLKERINEATKRINTAKKQLNTALRR